MKCGMDIDRTKRIIFRVQDYLQLFCGSTMDSEDCPAHPAFDNVL